MCLSLFKIQKLIADISKDQKDVFSYWQLMKVVITYYHLAFDAMKL